MTSGALSRLPEVVTAALGVATAGLGSIGYGVRIAETGVACSADRWWFNPRCTH